jgi:hypothetical protein
MFKTLRRPLLVLIVALALMAPASVMAETYREYRDHVQVQLVHWRHCRGGYWDRWGHWHAYRCWE